jgi:outer membrane scaffolding protein for murein synthesis (MipA/OmpV family)
MTLRLLSVCLLFGALTLPAWADETPAAPAVPAAPENAASAPSGKAAPDADKFEGAVGLVLGYGPAFVGSSDYKLKPQLAGFLRYGRVTVSGAGGFTTRRRDDVEQGLDAEVVRRGALRLDMALRVDSGRKEADSTQLTGMGDIKPTVRLRFGARWDATARWQLNASTSIDALNQVGGAIVSAGVAYKVPIDARQYVLLTTQFTGASDRYMQAWYGVSPEQAVASGYPVYRAAGGLASVSFGATWRIDFDPQWAGFVGATTAQLAASAADSPLTRQRSMWALSTGLVRRF